MSRPTIDSRAPIVPASKLLQKLAETLEQVRLDDDMSYVDLGEEIAKHADQAGKYCRSTAEMPASTLLRILNRWRLRFNPLMALIGLKMSEIDGGDLSDRKALTIIMRAQAEMAENLEDGELRDEELIEDRSWIEAAGAAFDRWRERLADIDRRSD